MFDLHAHYFCHQLIAFLVGHTSVGTAAGRQCGTIVLVTNAVSAMVSKMSSCLWTDCALFSTSGFRFVTRALIMWHNSLKCFIFGIIFSITATVGTATGRRCGLPSLSIPCSQSYQISQLLFSNVNIKKCFIFFSVCSVIISNTSQS